MGSLLASTGAASVRVSLCALFVLLGGACRRDAAEPRGASSEASAAPSPSPVELETARGELTGTVPAAPGSPLEAPPPRDPLERFVPPEQPHQRIAFSRYRLATLIEPPEPAQTEELSVRRLGDLRVVTRFPVPGAQNVAALTGGGFLLAGRDHVYRLSGVERRAESLPRAPRLGPTTLHVSSQEATQFWLRYAGIATLSRFALDGSSSLGTLVPLDFAELADFDQRALLSEGDGAFLYTTPRGFVRVDASGALDRMERADLAGRVFALLRAERRDQVWAATPEHAYLLQVRGEAETVEVIPLPPHPVALASRGRELAVLSVERLGADALGLRVDVHLAPRGAPRQLRFSIPWRDSDEPASARFEIDLAPEGDLVAVHAGSLFAGDFRRGEWLVPGPAAGAQNLAPSPP